MLRCHRPQRMSDSQSSLKNLKKSHGGARPNSGRKVGSKLAKTITKEQAREALRAIVIENLKPLVEAQLQNALGIRHTFLRNDAGRFVQLTDPKQIEAALNSGDEGKYYWTYTKDPSIEAFADLMNRTLDKPAEQINLTERAMRSTTRSGRSTLNVF